MAQALNNNLTESSFKGTGGLNIFTRSWRPEGKARGAVVIVHGFNSHSGQYLLCVQSYEAV